MEHLPSEHRGVQYPSVLYAESERRADAVIAARAVKSVHDEETGVYLEPGVRPAAAEKSESVRYRQYPDSVPHSPDSPQTASLFEVFEHLPGFRIREYRTPVSEAQRALHHYRRTDQRIIYVSVLRIAGNRLHLIVFRQSEKNEVSERECVLFYDVILIEICQAFETLRVEIRSQKIHLTEGPETHDLHLLQIAAAVSEFPYLLSDHLPAFPNLSSRCDSASSRLISPLLYLAITSTS